MRPERAMLGLALLLAATSVFLSALLFTRIADTTARTNDALCTFRADVRHRAESTRRFLADHPQGIPGIPVGTLRQSLDAQRRTVKALSDLDCPPQLP
jgi:hypothetical protein